MSVKISASTVKYYTLDFLHSCYFTHETIFTLLHSYFSKLLFSITLFRPYLNGEIGGVF